MQSSLAMPPVSSLQSGSWMGEEVPPGCYYLLSIGHLQHKPAENVDVHQVRKPPIVTLNDSLASQHDLSKLFCLLLLGVYMMRAMAAASSAMRYLCKRALSVVKRNHTRIILGIFV